MIKPDESGIGEYLLDPSSREMKLCIDESSSFLVPNFAHSVDGSLMHRSKIQDSGSRIQSSHV